MEGSPVTGQQRSTLPATAAVVLGCLSLLCLVFLGLGFVFDFGLVEDSDWTWFILVTLAVLGGAAAALLGSIGWIDARRGDAGGLRRAQIGSIAGGVAAGVVVFGTILIIAVFFYLMLNFPQGSIGPIA